MKRKACGWVCFLAFMLAVLQPCVLPAAFAADGRGGEKIAAGGDAGEPVSDSAPSSGGSNLWKWMLGVGAVALAGIAGYTVADQSKENKDDAEDAAAAAAASAAAASASATAPAGEEEFTTVIYITGTFQAGAADYNYNGGPLFQPSITFATESGAYPGGIIDYVSSTTGASAGLGGAYKQTSDASVILMVDDGYYLGPVTKVNSQTLQLGNGVKLYAVDDAKIFIMKK